MNCQKKSGKNEKFTKYKNKKTNSRKVLGHCLLIVTIMLTFGFGTMLFLSYRIFGQVVLNWAFRKFLFLLSVAGIVGIVFWYNPERFRQ